MGVAVNVLKALSKIKRGFRVGDIVRLLETEYEDTIRLVGKTGVVTEVLDACHPGYCPSQFCFKTSRSQNIMVKIDSEEYDSCTHKFELV